jgi:cytochrome P450
MRITASVTGRLARIAPDELLEYKGWKIPYGTPVSMDHHFTHLDPDIFPNPKKFDPDRWLRARENGQPLEKYLNPFGKGSRMCVGLK